MTMLMGSFVAVDITDLISRSFPFVQSFKSPSSVRKKGGTGNLNLEVISGQSLDGGLRWEFVYRSIHETLSNYSESLQLLNSMILKALHGRQRRDMGKAMHWSPLRANMQTSYFRRHCPLRTGMSSIWHTGDWPRHKIGCCKCQ
jgi:hypothetical protein